MRPGRRRRLQSRLPQPAPWASPARPRRPSPGAQVKGPRTKHQGGGSERVTRSLPASSAALGIPCRQLAPPPARQPLAHPRHERTRTIRSAGGRSALHRCWHCAPTRAALTCMSPRHRRPHRPRHRAHVAPAAPWTRSAVPPGCPSPRGARTAAVDAGPPNLLQPRELRGARLIERCLLIEQRIEPEVDSAPVGQRVATCPRAADGCRPCAWPRARTREGSSS